MMCGQNSCDFGLTFTVASLLRPATCFSSTSIIAFYAPSDLRKHFEFKEKIIEVEKEVTSRISHRIQSR